MPRTKQGARKSTGGIVPRASFAVCGPVVLTNDNDSDSDSDNGNDNSNSNSNANTNRWASCETVNSADPRAANQRMIDPVGIDEPAGGSRDDGAASDDGSVEQADEGQDNGSASADRVVGSADGSCDDGLATDGVELADSQRGQHEVSLYNVFSCFVCCQSVCQDYCYICINGGHVFLCDKCTRVVCSDHFTLPPQSDISSASFLCLVCHRDAFKDPQPYMVSILIILLFHF